jgi:hypothetical protein
MGWEAVGGIQGLINRALAQLAANALDDAQVAAGGDGRRCR